MKLLKTIIEFSVFSIIMVIINCGAPADPTLGTIKPEKLVYSPGERFAVGLVNDHDYSVDVNMIVVDSKGMEFETNYTSTEIKKKTEKYFYWTYNVSDWQPGPNCYVKFYDANGGSELASFKFHTAIECEVDYFYVENYDVNNLMGSTGRSNFNKACDGLLIDYDFSDINSPIQMFPSNVFNTETDLRNHVVSFYNVSYNWKLFSLTTNPTGDGALGYSTHESPNVPLENKIQRYAIVFAKDIENNYANTNERQFFYWYITAHELAHERFGLTDALYNPEYHQTGMGECDPVTYIYDAYCIMAYWTCYWDDGVDFVFCNKHYPEINNFDLDPFGDNTDNCWGNAYNILYKQQ